MLNHIKVEARFAGTGKEIQFDRDMRRGTTLVQGANEAGKSFSTCECPRFALYGSQALRGPLSTIEALRVELNVEIKGCAYTVLRSLSEARITNQNGVVLATGQRATTAKVEELMGFNLAVFDLAVACNQGEVESLMRMDGPTRKATIDKAVGLDRLDRAQKVASERLTEANAKAKALQELVGPEPVKPPMTDLPPVEELQKQLDLAGAQIHQRLELQHRLETDGAVDPGPLPTGASVEDLQTRLETLGNHMGQIDVLKMQLGGLEETVGTEPEDVPRPDDPRGIDELRAADKAYRAKAKQYMDLVMEIGGAPAPAHTETDLDKMLQQIRDHDDWAREENFRATHGPRPVYTKNDLNDGLDLCTTYRELIELQDRQAKLLENRMICPECHASIPVDPEAVDRVTNQLAGLHTRMDKLKETPLGPVIVQADFNLTHLRELQLSIEAWSSHTVAWEGPEPELPKYSAAEIESMRSKVRHLERFAERDQLAAEIEAMGNPTEVLNQLMAWSEHSGWVFKQRQIDSINRQLEALQAVPEQYRQVKTDLEARLGYDEACRRWQEHQLLQMQLDGIPNRSEEYDQLQNQLETRRAWNIKIMMYQKDHEAWLLRGQQAASAEDYATDWKHAGQALRELRTRIKAYLVPSLNTVASRILQQMTGGDHQRIEVSPGFDTIAVDDQPLKTLSGGASAVANLAIRIALGQVLTHKVFPVFIADEIDANMDQKRSIYTIECLHQLRSEFVQIVCVSHKPLEGDFDDQIIVA